MYVAVLRLKLPLRARRTSETTSAKTTTPIIILSPKGFFQLLTTRPVSVIYSGEEKKKDHKVPISLIVVRDPCRHAVISIHRWPLRNFPLSQPATGPRIHENAPEAINNPDH